MEKDQKTQREMKLLRKGRIDLKIVGKMHVEKLKEMLTPESVGNFGTPLNRSPRSGHLQHGKYAKPGRGHEKTSERTKNTK